MVSIATARGILIMATALATGLSACSISSPRNQAILNGSQGEQVSSLCFNRNINSWQELDSNTIVLRVNRNDYYRLDLAGICEANRAFLNIEVQSRSGICLEPGDRIDFDNSTVSGSCSVSTIHRWHPAPVAADGAD